MRARFSGLILTVLASVCGPMPLMGQGFPSLSIIKTAPATVLPGAQLTYTITYGNSGDAAAAGVIIRDPVPAGTTFVSATNGGTESAGIVTWNLGTVAAGLTGQTVSFTVSFTATEGSIVNQAYTIESSGLLPAAGPRVTTVIQSASPAVLTILKTASTPTSSLGAPFTFQVVVSNTGGTAAAPVQVTDTVPAGLVVGVVTMTPTGSCSVVGQAVSCSVPSLAAGASATVTIPVTASAPGPFANTASASFAGGSTVQSAASVTILDPSAATAVPAVSTWALLLFAAALGVAGLFVVKRLA